MDSSENYKYHLRMSVLGAIQDLKKNDFNTFCELFGLYVEENKPMPVINKFGWLVKFPHIDKFNIGKLKLYHHLLITFKYVSSEYEYVKFEIHHIGRDIPDDKIIWLDDIKVLVFLIYKLRERRVLPENENIFDLIHSHYVDRDGNEINKDNLPAMLSQCRKFFKRERELDNFIGLLTC